MPEMQKNRHRLTGMMFNVKKSIQMKNDHSRYCKNGPESMKIVKNFGKISIKLFRNL